MCQASHDVVVSKDAPRLTEDGMTEEGDLFLGYGVLDYVLVEHEAYGKVCRGTGDAPQALHKEAA